MKFCVLIKKFVIGKLKLYKSNKRVFIFDFITINRLVQIV